MQYQIKEYENGLFQVWKGDKILMPSTLKWENDYQWVHDFMFVKSEDDALKLIEAITIKEQGMQVKTITTVEVP